MTKSSSKRGEVIRRYTSISGAIDLLHRKEIAILNPENWDDRNDRHFMGLYKAHRNVEGLYGLCAAMCPETYHHWKVFTGGSAGACIVLKREPLERYLASIDMPEVVSVRYGDVKYLDLDDVRKLSSDDMTRLPFLKRSGFADESEYRIVVETRTKQQGAVNIHCPPDWIDRIYLNPWLPKSQAESVVAILKNIQGCEGLDIRRSFLIDSATWKQAGDKAAGLKPSRKIILKPRKTVAASSRKSKSTRAKS